MILISLLTVSGLLGVDSDIDRGNLGCTSSIKNLSDMEIKSFFWLSSRKKDRQSQPLRVCGSCVKSLPKHVISLTITRSLKVFTYLILPLVTRGSVRRPHASWIPIEGSLVLCLKKWDRTVDNLVRRGVHTNRHLCLNSDDCRQWTVIFRTISQGSTSSTVLVPYYPQSAAKHSALDRM